MENKMKSKFLDEGITIMNVKMTEHLTYADMLYFIMSRKTEENTPKYRYSSVGGKHIFYAEGGDSYIYFARWSNSFNEAIEEAFHLIIKKEITDTIERMKNDEN